MRKWLVVAAAAIAAALLGVAGGVYLKISREAEDVRGSSTEEFVATDVPETVAEEEPPPPVPRRGAGIPGVVWPMYGFGTGRVRTVGFDHKPPYRVLWR
ncbi:MAG: hypothetical protein ACRDNL_06290, partial [Spirillospora sp.]